jgi:hypothetical protein
MARVGAITKRSNCSADLFCRSAALCC